MLSSVVRAAALVLLCASGVWSAAIQSASTSRFTFYDMLTPKAGPCDLTVGPDNAIWIQDQLTDKIARIDPQTGKVTEYTIPYTNNPLPVTIPNVGGLTPLACAIQRGEDGNLYASAGTRNQFVQINPTTKAIKVFNAGGGLGDLQPFNDLYRAKDGMWFTQTTANLISFFNYKTHQFTNYQIPTPSSLPLGLYVASDGTVWFAEFGLSKIGRFDPTTKTFKEFPCPLGLTQPAVIRVQEGDWLYFTATSGNGIGGINIKTYQFKTFASPALADTPAVDIADDDGNVWYSSLSRNTLGKVNPKTGATHVVQIPVLGSGVAPPILTVSVTYLQSTNSLYFTQEANNTVGRYQLVV